MKHFKFLLALFTSALFASCGSDTLSTESKLLDALNNDTSIPCAYLDLIIPQKDFYIYNSDFYTQGAQWVRIDKTKANFSNAHKIELQSPQKFKANTSVINSDNRPVYIIYSEESKLNNCRGCSYCYQKFKDSGVLECDILDGEVGAGGNLKIKTKFTDKGLKYKLVPLREGMMEESNIEFLVLAANYKFSKIKSYIETPSGITAQVEYYLEYSPFGEALGYKTDKKNPQVGEFEFEKVNDGSWRVKSQE